MILNKICRLCKQEKDINRFSFRKDSNKYRTECKDCLNKKRRESKNYGKWHKENKSKVKKYMRNYDLKRKYGITEKEFNIIFKKQNNKCAICGTQQFNGKGNKPHVDHCHNSKEIRGILCGYCNVGLGHFKDNIDNLKKAIEYLVDTEIAIMSS